MRILFSGRPFYRHQYAQLNPTGLTMVIMNYVPHDPLLLSDLQDPLQSSLHSPCVPLRARFLRGGSCVVCTSHTHNRHPDLLNGHWQLPQLLMHRSVPWTLNKSP